MHEQRITIGSIEEQALKASNYGEASTRRGLSRGRGRGKKQRQRQKFLHIKFFRAEADIEDMITTSIHLTIIQSLISPTLNATATTSLNALQTFVLTKEIIQTSQKNGTKTLLIAFQLKEELEQDMVFGYKMQ